MSDLVIRQQHLATRCEVCHQSDLFSPQTNICLRCSDIGGSNKPKNKKKGTTYNRFKLPVNIVAARIIASTCFTDQQEERPSRKPAININYRPTKPIASPNSHQKAIGYVSFNGINTYFSLPSKFKPKRKVNPVFCAVVILLAVLCLIQYFSS